MFDVPSAWQERPLFGSGIPTARWPRSSLEAFLDPRFRSFGIPASQWVAELQSLLCLEGSDTYFEIKILEPG